MDLLPARPAGAAPATAGSFVLTGKHVLLSFVTFFLVVAAVNGYMMFAAISTMPGLDAGRNGYDVSQRYNGEIQAAEAQAARGWRSDAELSVTAAGTQAIVVFTDRAGAAIGGLDVEMRLMHPSSRQMDRALTLKPMAPGTYAAPVGILGPGAWDVVITASRDGARLYQSRNRKQI
jgi:nitrogen fixation protein FixH